MAASKRKHNYPKGVTRPGNKVGRCGTLADRFWKKVEMIPFHECWEWVGAQSHFGNRHKNGYGAMKFFDEKLGKFVNKNAHIVSFELNVGPIPEGMNVLHKCDNPPCVNPAHLYAGSQSQNVKEMWDRGRRE